jgi:hypothetical protein
MIHTITHINTLKNKAIHRFDNKAQIVCSASTVVVLYTRLKALQSYSVAAVRIIYNHHHHG